MNLDELLNEKIKKVHGKWALVSKSNPDKVLQYYHGKDHPSKEWEKKVERRIHAFSHMNEADIHKTIDDIRQNVHADELEGLKRYSNAQLADWLKRLTAKNKSVIGPAMATVDSLGPLAKPFARTFVQRQYPTVDNDEFEQMWGVWNRMDDETRSAIKAGDLSTLDPRDEHGFVKETNDDIILNSINEYNTDSIDPGYDELFVPMGLLNRFKDSGWYPFEGGRDQAVLSKRNSPYVLKIVGRGSHNRIDAIRQYVNFFRHNQHNPHFPKVGGDRMLTWEGKKYYAYTQEELTGLPSDAIMDYLEATMESFGHSGKQPNFDKIPEGLSVKQVKGLMNAVNELLASGIGNTHVFDLSNVLNIMQRKNGQLVIVDPFTSFDRLDPSEEYMSEADDDYETWKQRAIERAKRQAEKKRAELQQVMKGVETDPEKLALQGTIQAARAELNKRKREDQEKLAKLTAKIEAMSDSELDQLISATWASQRNSQFYKFLKSVKAERAEAKQAKQDLLRSVAGNVQGKQTHKTAPAQDAPWTQMGIDRKSFRKILNNPQHPKHREARSLHAQYKPVAEDLTRRDFLKGVGAVGALGLASSAAKAFGLKDPTKTADSDEQYKRFVGTSQSPLHADPRLDLNNTYNRVGVNQRGSQFSVVLTKDHGLYLYFEVTDFAESPYAYIELRNGEKYKFRKRTLRNNIFTIEDDRIAATLLNYEGPFNLYVDNDVYTFNIASSPDAQKLYRWWKEGKHEGL
jgi:hypothetical protein